MLGLLIAAMLSTTPAAPIVIVPPPTIIDPPAPLPPPPNPVRLVVARRIAAKLVLNDSYRNMINHLLSVTQMGMEPLVITLLLRNIASVSGVPDNKLASMTPTSVSDIVSILDPNFASRVFFVMTAMKQAMFNATKDIEPVMREEMAVAYATRFTAAQLSDIDGFLASSTGSLYAAQQFQLIDDPTVWFRMQKVIETMAAQMPTVLAQATAAVDGLPKPRTYADLTVPEKAKLATLLGVAPETLK